MGFRTERSPIEKFGVENQDCMAEISLHLNVYSLIALKKPSKVFNEMFSNQTFLERWMTFNINLLLVAPDNVKKNKDLQKQAFDKFHIKQPFHKESLSPLMRLPSFKENVQFLKHAMLCEPNLGFRYLPKSQKKLINDDKAFIATVIKSECEIPWQIQDLSPRLQKDRDIAALILAKNGLEFRHLPAELQNDSKLQLLARQTCPSATLFVRENEVAWWKRWLCCCFYYD